MNRGERSVWDLVESDSILFMLGYLAARARAFEHPIPLVRLLAERDHAHSDAVLMEHELSIYSLQCQRNPASIAQLRATGASENSATDEIAWMELPGSCRSICGPPKHHSKLEEIAPGQT